MRCMTWMQGAKYAEWLRQAQPNVRVERALHVEGEYAVRGYEMHNIMQGLPNMQNGSGERNVICDWSGQMHVEGKVVREVSIKCSTERAREGLMHDQSVKRYNYGLQGLQGKMQLQTARSKGMLNGSNGKMP